MFIKSKRLWITSNLSRSSKRLDPLLEDDVAVTIKFNTRVADLTLMSR